MAVMPKKKAKLDEKRVRPSVVASYTLALGGQNIIFGIKLNFLMFAFTDLLGLMPAAVATLLLLARLFDID